MHILIATDSGALYDIAVHFAQIGCNVSFYNPQASEGVVIDKYEVVHVSSWQAHKNDADLLIVDDPRIYYQYKQGGGRAPVLFYSNEKEGVARLVPPTALSFLASLLTGEVIHPRRWWQIWRRNA